MSYLFIIAIGAVLGYFFKPLVLKIVSAICLVPILWSWMFLASPSHSGSLADVIPVAALIVVPTLVVAMWVTHFLRAGRPENGWLKSIKKKTLK